MLFDIIISETFPYQQVLSNLEKFGFFHLIIPFFLFYVIIYVALSKVKVFDHLGDKKDRFVKLISFLFTLLVVLPYAQSPSSQPLVGAALRSIQPISIFLLVFILLLIVIEFMGGQLSVNSWTGFFILLIVISSFVAYFFKIFDLDFNNPLFFYLKEFFNYWSNSGIWKVLFSTTAISIYLLLFFVVLFLYFITDGKLFSSMPKSVKEAGEKALNDVKFTFVPVEVKSEKKKS